MQGGTTLNATNLNNLGATTSDPANLQPLGLTSSFMPALSGATSSLTGQLNVGYASTGTNSNNAWTNDGFVPGFAGAAIKPAGYSATSPGPLTSVGNDTMLGLNLSNKNFVSPTLGTGYQTPSTIGIVTPFNTSIKAQAQNFSNIAGVLGSPQQQGQNQQKSMLNSNSNNNQIYVNDIFYHITFAKVLFLTLNVWWSNVT